jgi:ATP-binding cassette subfamily B protein
MTQTRDSDLQIVARYTDQPATLPPHVRTAIEKRWDGEPVQLYAMADLDGSMRLTEIWLALGPRHLALALPAADGGEPEIQSFERGRIRDLAETPGLSCNVLSILGGPGEPALAVLRYTQRQRKAIENISFVIERQLEGVEIATPDPDLEYVESLARPIRDAQALVAHRRIAVLWRLLAYLYPYRRDFMLGMTAATLLTVCALIPPFISGYLIDSVIEPAQSGALGAQRAAMIAWIAVAGLAFVYLLRQLCNWVRLRLMAVLGEFVARDLRTDLYEHLQSLSLSFFSRKKTGSLITRVTNDTDRLWEFLALGVVDVSLAAVTLLGLSSVLIYLDWRLGLVMTLPVPLLCWGIFRHGQRMNEMFLRAWRKWSGVTDVLSDTIPGMRVVKAFNQEEREKKRFGLRNYDVVGEFNRIHGVWTSFWPVLTLAVHAMVLTVWVFAVPRLVGVETAAPGLSAGTFVAFLLYMTMFGAPIEIIGQMARIMNRATSSAHRVFEVLDTRPEVRDAENPLVLDPVMGGVSFENATFAYDGVRQVLKGISFDAKPGEMIGLVGPSGGGKTTIINLIARFYDATSGVVRIDGVDVRDLDSGRYRQQIGMVLQDPYLFFGTVLENIRYAEPMATVDQIVEAARAANAHDFICKLAHGYDTLVGERGQTLSGGERQRVSIARAILHNPRILILDEATSSVDTETEWKIQDALSRLVAGRTVFAIAHRLSTLKRADRLFVVDDGRIVESGTHGELLSNPTGIYTRLHKMQIELQEAV